MIGFLKGKLLDSFEGKLTVFVSAHGEDGVGYLVHTPNNALYTTWQPGQAVGLYVHTHVREDAMDLYGFASPIERDIFICLLSVTGIGPKGALSILSHLDPAELVEAILQKNKDTLTKIPGVGKKTAERLILELSDPLKKRIESNRWTLLPTKQRPSGASVHETTRADQNALTSAAQDAHDALIALGYRESQVTDFLHTIDKESISSLSTEELIRLALKSLR